MATILQICREQREKNWTFVENFRRITTRPPMSFSASITVNSKIYARDLFPLYWVQQNREKIHHCEHVKY